MTKGYKKMLVFQLAVFVIFILNSFVSNILSGYNFPIFLFLSLLLFKFVFGFEKDKYRYTKEAIYEIVIFLTIFFVLFYLSGIAISFAKTPNYYSFEGFTTFVLPLILTIILKEILRFMMLRKCESSKLLKVIVFFLFCFMDISEAIYYNGFDSNYGIFLLIALTILPAISKNLVLNYLTLKIGFRPLLLYLLVTSLYEYLIPIIPNPNEYISAIIRLLLPVFLLFKMRSFFKDREGEEIQRDYNKKRILPIIIPLAFTIVVVYFISGYFKYSALAIATGSMEPVISRGDIVIVEKVTDGYDKLEVGQILVHTHNGSVIVHRIVKIFKDEERGKYYFYTKGDANPENDNYDIAQEEVLGITNFVIPYLGLPTIWLNEV